MYVPTLSPFTGACKKTKHIIRNAYNECLREHPRAPQAKVLTMGGAWARFTCPLTVVYWAPAMWPVPYGRAPETYVQPLKRLPPFYPRLKL